MKVNFLKNIIVKRILLSIGILLLIVFAANYQYVFKQVNYLFTGYDKVTPSPLVTTDKVDLEKKDEFMEKDSLVIVSLGIKAPIIYPEENSETEFQRSLQYGVVQYPGTAPVGANGNTYIFGHSSDYSWSKGDYKTVFALLPNIQNDAEIKVSDHAGKVYTYKVKDQFVAENTDIKLLKQDKTKKQLTLQTSYPIGTALKRYIVVAELTE